MSRGKASAWSASDLPDLSCRRVVVTGADRGVGARVAAALAERGAEVTVCCPDRVAADQAVAAIQERTPAAAVQAAELDLADLDSVRSFAEVYAAGHSGLDLLVNSAGGAAPRGRSADGFELQLGVIHLGHFALTGRLLPLLLAGSRPRVVTLTSLAARYGRLRFADLHHERRYSRWLAYGQARLAALVFAVELQRRAEEAGAPLVSVAAHPGYAVDAAEAPGGPAGRLGGHATRLGAALFGQPVADGALPALYAAAASPVMGGALYAPAGFGQLRGRPRPAPIHRRAMRRDQARLLWRRSEELTGVRYELTPDAVRP